MVTLHGFSLGFLGLLQSFEYALFTFLQLLPRIFWLFLLLRRWLLAGHSINPPGHKPLSLLFALRLFTFNNAEAKLFLHLLIFTIHAIFEIAETFQTRCRCAGEESLSLPAKFFQGSGTMSRSCISAKSAARSFLPVCVFQPACDLSSSFRGYSIGGRIATCINRVTYHLNRSFKLTKRWLPITR